jgi:hypothetical protein
MRLTTRLVLAIGLALALTGPVAAIDDLDVQPLPGASVTSDNVEHLGYLADVGPTVSARVVEVGEDKRLYVGSIGRGLSIYDLADPEQPALLGMLPIPGFQNEDLAVSVDGDIAVLAHDTTGANHFIDTSDPTDPRLGTRLTPGDHTIECVVEDCTYAYGSSGRLFDLSDIDDVQVVGNWQQVVRDQGHTIAQTAHAVHRDPQTGYIITDTVPRYILDVSADPLNPVVVTEIGVFGADNLRYQHNGLWPRSEEAAGLEPRGEDEALRPGEILLATGETNFAPRCGAANGPFFTMDISGWDEGAPGAAAELEDRVLDVYRPPANSVYLDGNPAANALGCSAHWFNWTDDTASDDGDYVVALGAFEHGARFLSVDAATGAIDEIGWFQPFNGSAAAAYWVTDEIVYVTDYVRGIDILRFDHEGDRPEEDEVARSWVASTQRAPLEITKAEQLICRLAMEG